MKKLLQKLPSAGAGPLRIRKILEWGCACGLLLTIVLTAAAVRYQTVCARVCGDTLRLHILANSDTVEDQLLKLQVRDAVLEQATETLRGADSQAEASRRLTDILPELEETARVVITANGYDYGVRAELAETSFPTKEYDGFALPAGEYLALRVLIGEAAGQNWWCVVFPPLCTAAASDVPTVALDAGLTDQEVALITEADEGYILKFKSVELWQTLKAKLTK